MKIEAKEPAFPSITITIESESELTSIVECLGNAKVTREGGDITFTMYCKLKKILDNL